MHPHARHGALPVDALTAASVLWEVTVAPHSSISVYLETIMSRERRGVRVRHKRFEHSPGISSLPG